MADDAFTDDASFDQDEPDVDEFYRALGQLVTTFSRVEGNIQRVLWHLVGVRPPTAQVVFSGVRTDAAMKYINRLADALKWPDKWRGECQFIFSQLGQINLLRNEILHYGSSFETKDIWTVSNKRAAHIPENIRVLRITPAVLNDASTDLEKIDFHLDALALSESEIIEAEGYCPPFAQARKRAWRYKPPQQVAHPQTSRKPHRKRKDRRGPSRP